jgi:type IV pilus assembly protein PilQ
MTSFWRYTLFGIFGAAGMALALCVALSGGSAAETSITDTPPSADSAPVLEPKADFAAAPAVQVSDSRQDVASQPAREQMNAPIAQKQSFLPPQQSFSAQQTYLPPEYIPPPQYSQPPALPTPQMQSQAGPLLAQAQGQAPTNDAELMDLLRKQLQKSMQTPGDIQAPAERPRSPLPPQVRPETVNAPPTKGRQSIRRIPGEGDNNLSINIQDADLRDVLGMLSEQGGLNILPSPGVQGKVSASLNGVDIDTALNAILRSTGFIAKRDGRFIYVGSPADFKLMDQSIDTVGTRVYHLNYVRASDIQSLVTPLLTPGIGTISVTAPANEGIAADSTKVGGDQFAGGDSVLIHDFVAVLDQIEQVIGEIDRHPAQVHIEAMILRVKLHDELSFGIDFELLRQNPNFRLASGSPLASVNDLDFKEGGLKVAFLNGSTNAFIQALETIGDTNVIATPRLMVVDKARAEVLIGKQLGYVNTTITETSTAQNVQFLEVGTQLRLRPFISGDGLVRLEVHPEVSDGTVEVKDGFTLPQKETTQVTTNVIVPDGCTVIIGGLLQDSLKTDGSQIPLLGSLPGIGWLFRNKHEVTEKEETVVLITPHIVCGPDACCEGDKAAAEFHRRHAVYADQMSPLGKRYIGRKYYRLAQAAWAQGDQKTALRFADLSVHFDPESRAAINLRTDIWNGNLTGDHTLLKADVNTPGGYIDPIPGAGPMEIEGPAEIHSPGDNQPAEDRNSRVPPSSVAPPKATRRPAPNARMVQVSDTPDEAPPLLPVNAQAVAMQSLPAPSAGPMIDTAVMKASNEVPVGPRISGYNAEQVQLPPAPSAALPVIQTRPLARMSTTPQLGAQPFGAPPTRAEAIAAPTASPSTVVGPTTQPSVNPMTMLPNTRSVLVKRQATPPPAPANPNPTGVQPVNKTTVPGKPDAGVDNQQLPDWMLDGLLQTRSSAPDKLPTGPSRAMEPTQK